MAYVFTVNGSTKALQPGWSIQESANSRNRFSGRVLSLTGTYRPANDDVVVLTEAGTTIFGGLIDNPQEKGITNNGFGAGIETAISAADFNVYASRVAILSDTTRSSESLKDRLTWIAGLLSAQSVTIDAGQATGPTLPAATYTAGQYLVDVLDQTVALANGTGSASWIWEIDYSLVMRAIEAGTVSAPFNIADGDGHVVGDITVDAPRPSTYGNYIVLLGGTGTRDVSDTFTGNGSTVTFALTYSLSTSYGYVTVNGVFETLGTGATWTYDSSTNSITRTTAPAVAATVFITNVGQFPKRVISDGGASAANRVVKTYTETAVFDAAVMQALADAYLTRDMDSPRTVHYKLAVTLTGVHPGQTLTITSAKRNLSSTHLITDVVISNIGGNIVQRQVTAVTSQLLPATLRQQFQQTFAGSGGGAASASSVTVVTGGTYLSSPATLGGSDTLYRLANSWVRVPNALPYVAPASLAVKIRGTVAAHSSVNVSVRLRDEVNSVTGASAGPVAATATPADYLSAAGSVVSGHTYWLEMESGTSGVEVTAIGHVESA